MKRTATRIITIVWVALTLVVLFTPAVAAQDFAGNDTSNYTCPILPEYQSYAPMVGSDFMCTYLGGHKTNAIPKPPTLQVLQYWFIRIIYGAWAISGIVFSAIMSFLGFKYMTSRGDPAAISDVKKRARNWFIGLVLIFLSYPLLHTLFSVIGISRDDCFKNISLPAFQFFFPDACTASSSITTGN